MSSEKKLSFMDADPNLVPFQESWRDNTGSIANAIFWLKKNWTKQLNAQGDFVDAHGRRWFWNYGWMTGILLVHINGSRECWEIDSEKMLHCADGNREYATIYRPFFSAQRFGESLYDKGEPVVTWEKTREFRVIKNHHENLIPLYLETAYNNMRRMLDQHPLGQFPQVKLGGLLFDKELVSATSVSKTAPLTREQALAYSELLKQINFLKNADYRLYEEHHIHSYTALMKFIGEFNVSLVPQWNSESKIKMGLFEEMNRLCREGHPKDAAIVDALGFERTWAESYEKTLDLTRANCPHWKENA